MSVAGSASTAKTDGTTALGAAITDDESPLDTAFILPAFTVDFAGCDALIVRRYYVVLRPRTPASL